MNTHLAQLFRHSARSARRVSCVFVLLQCLVFSGCSIRRYAINQVGDALASGNSVYETEEDLELAGESLPFGLKLMESLLNEAPRHRGLLLAASRGFVLYSYAYVDYEAEVAEETDLEKTRALRLRARRLYLRAFRYGMQGLEGFYPGFEGRLFEDPGEAVRTITDRKRQKVLPFLYWTGAALGLAISVSRDDTAMLARLPEVQALLDRALALDEGWDAGALHSFKLQLAGAKVGDPDWNELRRHYQRALELSEGQLAAPYVAYAEAVSVPRQDRPEFRSVLERALVIDPDRNPEDRLANLLAQRRARWLLQRVDELILPEIPGVAEPGGEK